MKSLFSTSKPPLFNYVAFIKNLSIVDIDENILEITSRCTEIFKMFMNQISLKNLDFNCNLSYISNLPLLTYPGAKDCLKNLSGLICNSHLCSEFFYQLSQVCYDIQSLYITYKEVISDGLADLKYLSMIYYFHDLNDLTEMISSLAKLSNTLIKLVFHVYNYDSLIPLSFLIKFTNLQQLNISFDDPNNLGDLQYATFSQLRILEHLINFLEINGKNLKELYLGFYNNLFYLDVHVVNFVQI